MPVTTSRMMRSEAIVPGPMVKGAEWRQERDHRVDHVDALRQDLGDDVDDQEGHRAERGRPVSRLYEHPVTRVKEHSVSGDKSETDGRTQSDKRENACVKQHEMLSSGVDNMTSTGQREKC